MSGQEHKGLTRQQQIALRWLMVEGPACEQGLRMEGIRPRPTLFNLVKKGLAENLGWNGVGLDDQVGYVFKITPAGEGCLDV
jgi:hypothetical protein